MRLGLLAQWISGPDGTFHVGSPPLSGPSWLSDAGMIRRKRLRGIAHDLAHHAVSGLSFLHPHIRQSQPEAERIAIDLQVRSEDSCSPAVIATEALRSKFAGLLEAAGLDAGTLRAASATFFYQTQSECPDWPYACHVRLELANGEAIEDAVGADGRRAEIVRPEK